MTDNSTSRPRSTKGDLKQPQSRQQNVHRLAHSADNVPADTPDPNHPTNPTRLLLVPGINFTNFLSIPADRTTSWRVDTFLAEDCMRCRFVSLSATVLQTAFCYDLAVVIRVIITSVYGRFGPRTLGPKRVLAASVLPLVSQSEIMLVHRTTDTLLLPLRTSPAQ